MVRAVLDYALFIFYPREEKLGIKLERAQFLDLRTALGLRQITPINIIAEAGVMLIKNKASYLAENFMLKTLTYRNKILKERLIIMLEKR